MTASVIFAVVMNCVQIAGIRGSSNETPSASKDVSFCTDESTSALLVLISEDVLESESSDLAL